MNAHHILHRDGSSSAHTRLKSPMTAHSPISNFGPVPIAAGQQGRHSHRQN